MYKKKEKKKKKKTTRITFNYDVEKKSYKQNSNKHLNLIIFKPKFSEVLYE